MKIIKLFNISITTDLFYMLKNLKFFFYVFDWFALLFRKIKTNKLKNNAWIKSINNLFWSCKTSLIYLNVMIFLIFFMTFCMIIARWIIVDVKTSFSIIFEYASNINKIKINSLKSTKLLIILKIIYKTKSKSIFEISKIMIM